MKNASRRPAYPVLPVFTHEWGAWDGTMTKQTVNSKTAAIRLCRNLGYRVLTKGGLVELVPAASTAKPDQSISHGPSPYTRRSEP